MIQSASEIRDAIRQHASKTTVGRLAAQGVRGCRVLDMATLERIFQRAVERALERSLPRLPAASRRAVEREARDELRELIREEQQPADPSRERKLGLLEAVFLENLALRGLSA